MALTLPQNFKNDIQGRDTALVPLVAIGNWISTGWVGDSYLISTNQQQWGTRGTLPILLNIPSLKESIDIEKRNYKISSVNLDISNFPYEGERFSELVSDTSLINIECRIFWASPSATTLEIYDYNNIYENTSAFEVYNGTIRRYTHDDEKVRLVVEDRSQATLHRDLPLPKNYLGTGADVPDKYKNKPIPMVYGFVDRSPCVISTQVETEDYGAIGKILIVDSDTTVSTYTEDDIEIGGHNFPTSELYINEGGEFFNIAQNSANYSEYNFTPSGNIITFNLNGSSDIAIDGVIVTNVIRKILKHTFHANDWYSFFQLDAHTAGDTDTDLSSSDNVIFDLEENGVFDGQIPSEYAKYLQDSDITTRLRIKGVVSDTNDTWAYVQFHLQPTSLDFDCTTYVIMDVQQGTSHEALWEAVPGLSGYGTYDIDEVSFPTGNKNNFNTGGAKDFPLSGFSNMSGYQGFSIGMPNPHDYDWWSTTEHFQANLFIKEGHLWQEVYVDNILAKDFYANVRGREITETFDEVEPGGFASSGELSPSAPRAIIHILKNELDPNITISDQINYQEQTAGYRVWQYAFTVDKKINSKKLIEGIASASPYIPRFDNMGNFKFSVIETDYHDGYIQEDNQTIKETDVIDFSFSRTPIEDVVTKIEFKYKWDYARGEFEKRRVLDIQNWACPNHGLWESFDYYGLPLILDEDGDIHPESTLVIDDDRGKYIRDNETAEKFVCWMMSWYCNQHLIMKVKLPLKYMDLEIGDIVRFGTVVGDNFVGELLGGIKPYGIDYTKIENPIQTFQEFLPYFMVTETNKRLDYVEISCTQMHHLWAEVSNPVDEDGNMSYV